jgi:hypothetical protein
MVSVAVGSVRPVVAFEGPAGSADNAFSRGQKLAVVQVLIPSRDTSTRPAVMDIGRSRR